MLQYGDAYLIHLLHTPHLVLSHPKYVESLVSHPEFIAKGKTYSHLQPWLGNGLLTSTGTRWRNTRKFLTPAFHFNILQNFLPVFLKNEKILIEKLHEYADGRSFNALPVMALTALDNVTESIMGVSVDAQQNSGSKYVKSIEILAHIVSLRMRNPFMGEDAIFNFSSQKKQQDEALECVHSHTKEVITMRREELKRANITKLTENGHCDIGIKNKHAFLDLLLLAEVDGEKIKDDQVREEVDTFMFEGHDTTASGLTFALYCISKRPDVQQKIIEEQKYILGEDLNRDPTYSEIQQMKYLDLVIKESLRLYPSVPLIGRMITEDAQFLPLLRNLMLKYGDAYLIHLLHTPHLVLSHPKYVESLVSHPEFIAKGKTYSHLQPWLGNGLLTSTGNRWRNTRKFLTPAFHFNILQNFLPVFLKNEKILIEKLHEYADGRSFNALPVMALTALDNVTESIMGVSVDAQQNSESKYVKSIEILAHIVSLRMRNPFMGEDAIFNFSSQKKQQDEALECVHSHTKEVITMRREELKRANITKLTENGHCDIGIKNKHAFLDLLLLAEVDGEKIRDDQVREEVDTFMFEGHDTTASGLTFALYCISKRPDVQQKIIEEQKYILGEDLNRDPTYSEIQQMKYLDLVIKESLRLYPSVPLIGRMITEDAQLGELIIPKNTSILINILELQRHPDLYDNPMEFDPERFTTTSANTAKNAFSWLAFSAGPRNCIGQKFAMLELKVTLAGIVKKFHLLPDHINEPVLCAELVLRSESGVPIKLKPRKLT